jgi:anti-sigma factor RsiW
MRTTCDHCQDLLWDYVYGLLEADQVQGVSAHLAACGTCQDARIATEAQQARLARAARLDVKVPPFVPPAPEPVAADAPPLRPAAPRAFRPRSWPWLAAAAALLLAVGLPYGIYQAGLARHRQALRETLARRTEAEAQVAQSQQQVRADQEALQRDLRANHLRVQVLGPASYQPGVPSPYQVVTTDLDGRPAPARVTARLVADDGQVLFEAKDLPGRAEQTLVLPPDLALPPAATARLEVVAHGQNDREQLQEPLRVAAPTYMTHLALAKPVYRPGETVFFRSLTLDRFGRKPPEQPLRAHYVLRDANGKMLQELTVPTRDGIGGGEWVLPAEQLDGEYSLTVTEAEDRFPPQTRRFWVSSTPPARLRKTLQFDRRSYQPGDVVRADFRAVDAASGVPASDRPLQVSLDVDGRPVGTPLVLRTDAQGAAALQVPLPADLPAGLARLTVAIEHQERPELLIRSLPRTASDLRVEFFPEGGDLIAGVPNRVYFRVRTPQGQPAELEGQVMDSQGRPAATVQTARLADQAAGAGVFRFLPQPGETYTLRGTSPTGMAVTAALPAVADHGVALQVPAAVSREGEPIRILLHGTEPERPLLVGLFCGGRLVAQQRVTVKPGGTEVQLTPAAGLAGVLRVTAFDLRNGQLRPMAERLVYRLPAERLALAVQAEKEGYQPGERVRLTVRSGNEQGQPEPAWVLLGVVDRDAVEEAGELLGPNLPGYFYLANEIRRPEDLEHADFLISADAGAGTALDLFLGTQGWRCFRDPGEQPVLAQAGPGEEALVLLDNADQVGRKAEAAQAVALARLHSTAAARERELGAEARRWDEEAREADHALAAYAKRGGEYLRLGAGVGVLALLGASCVLLALAVVRTLRGLPANTPYFAGAFAALLLCVVTFYGFQAQLGATGPGPLVSGEGDRVAQAPRPAPEKPLGFALPAPGTKPRVAVHTIATRTARRTDAEAVRERLLALAERRGEKSAEARTPARVAADSPRKTTPGKALSQPPTAMRSSQATPRPPSEGSEVAGPVITFRPLRVYAYGSAPPAGGQELAFPEVLLWSPALLIREGAAEVSFDLPRYPATYRILAQGHSPSGRLGLWQGHLETRAAAGAAPR